MTKSLKQFLVSKARQTAAEARALFMPVPNQACDCGKPIVFPYPKTRFKCTRCGNRWQLKISVTKITSKAE